MSDLLLANDGLFPVCWGNKVSKEFIAEVFTICASFGWAREQANDLMACMAFESGETFSPSVRNAAGSGATGLIQFMPATAISYFHTEKQIEAMTPAQKKAAGTAACAALAALTPVQQLAYVRRYFAPYAARIRSLSDMYMAILWPRAVGQAENYVLFDEAVRPTAYKQNAGLDTDKDKRVTKAEASAKVLLKQKKGFEAGRVAYV